MTVQVPVMNALKVDCACVGNHDFDFGERQRLDDACPLSTPELAPSFMFTCAPVTPPPPPRPMSTTMIPLIPPRFPPPNQAPRIHHLPLAPLQYRRFQHRKDTGAAQEALGDGAVRRADRDHWACGRVSGRGCGCEGGRGGWSAW